MSAVPDAPDRDAPGRDASVVGPWTRVRIAVAVGLSLALFAIACGLVTWLAERPGLHARLDLTRSGRNTLDPVLADLVDKLPEPATIEVFFQPIPPQLGQAGHEAQRLTANLLDVLRNAAPEKVRVIFHSPDNIAEARDALSRLHVDGDEFGLLVVHREKKTAVLRLFKDIAQLDFGQASLDAPMESRIASFRGEEALAGALKRVAADHVPKLYFSVGHGERNLYGAKASDGNESNDLGALVTALVADGFETERFEGNGNPVPDDCAALSIVDPSQALSESEVAAIHAYVARGGRVLLTGSHRYPDGFGSTSAIAAKYGIDLGAGYVAEPMASPSGLLTGRPECANIFTDPGGLQVRHPVTESLVTFGRNVWCALSHPVLRKNPPSNVLLTELVRSSDSSWIDLPDNSGTYDWTPADDEPKGKRFPLAFAADVAPALNVGPIQDELRGRLIVLGSPEMLTSRLMVTNKDFALNAFNWLAARDYRISVAPHSDERHLIDVKRGNALVKLRSLVVFLLPGAFAILGFLTWVRRRR
ncbi:MAG TPA: GldG family protein [Planctomycetota bacterium]|nr:GldG family protein [Planctomycetota bacterium]